MEGDTLSTDSNRDMVRGLPWLFTFQGRQRIEDTKHYFLFHAGFLLGLLFNPEDEGDMLLRSVS
jgi:hypothetical protein